MKESRNKWKEVLIGTLVGLLAILITIFSYWLLLHYS